MSSFSDALARFGVRSERKIMDVFVLSVGEVERSVREGSELTGAPGQPVDTGNLFDSWIGEYTGYATWELTTNVIYAADIERGSGPNGKLTLRSQVGGFHSVKYTRTGWDLIVADCARRVSEAS